MAKNDNGTDAPKAFCDRHSIGYVKALGCADCNGMKAESKAKEITKVVSDVVSVRVFPHEQLVDMMREDKLAHCKNVLNTSPTIVLPNLAYLFVSKTNSNMLYFKVNNEQAIEITINVEKAP